jgi:ATPase subunit of ABC transporter with duplicated ATPase domains
MIYAQAGRAVNDEAIARTLSEYLFERTDGQVPVQQLSGGQKARIQLIAMLAARPNLLILDEPTNHLDLPSIEELERALQNYSGAVLYISHDSFFAKALGGEVINIGA